MKRTAKFDFDKRGVGRYQRHKVFPGVTSATVFSVKIASEPRRGNEINTREPMRHGRIAVRILDETQPRNAGETPFFFATNAKVIALNLCIAHCDNGGGFD